MARSIVHVITGLETGGAEMMLLKLLSGTDRGRWRSSVVSLADRGTLGARIESLGVPVSPVGIRGSVPSPVALWRLVKEVRRLSPSLVLGWMYHGNLAAQVAGMFGPRPVRVVWNIRQSLSSLSDEKPATARAIRLGARLFDMP
jgi:hypothetical protein